MSVPSPLAFGVPGGMELVVLFFVLFFLVVPLALVALGVWYLANRDGGGSPDRSRVAELESKVADLESELAALRERVDDENR